MSIGSIIGGVLGAIIGWIAGGPYGAAVGFVVGFGLGMAVDPMQADVSQAGVPIQQLQMPDNTIGAVIPDVLGTAKIAGMFLCYGQESAIAQTQESGGKGGGGSSQITGYKYYMSWAQAICMGPVDELFTILKNNDEVLWSGELARPPGGGPETISVPEYGTIRFYFGTETQAADPTVAAIIGDATLNSPLRGLCYAVMVNYYIGEYNRCPSIKFVLKKTPAISELPAQHAILPYDYNPAHALYYIFNSMVGLPADWLDTDSFAATGAVLFSENRGISICFDQQQTALAYIEAVNSHAESIVRYGAQGAFIHKLIRNDYVVEELPLIDEDIILEDPTFTRKSWMDTINEIKVQYSEIYGGHIITKAYFAGGLSGGNFFDVIDGLTFEDETIAVLSAVLSVARDYLAAAGSSLKGYFAGGEFYGGVSDVIDALTFSSEAVYPLAAELPLLQNSVAGSASSLKAYFAGGAQYPSNIIQALDFSAETTAILSAVLSEFTISLAAAASALKAYFAGGYSGPPLDKIDALTFSNETCVALAATLPYPSSTITGVSSALKAYFADMNGSGHIAVLTFGNETAALLGASLSVGHLYPGGAGSPDKAYFAGGVSGGNFFDVIDGLTFEDETVAALSAVLSVARGHLAGVGAE